MIDTEYDHVPYRTRATDQTHPDHLSALGRLFGIKTAEVERCRVLELGCGDGSNLIPMAHGLPKSEFVGMDLAGSAIRAGMKKCEHLKLKNIRLLHQNIMEFPPAPERFDYIIAHGLFSWVPEPVREKILDICRNRLTQNGIAFISYNALPGGYLRMIANDIMSFHAGNFSDPEQKMLQAHAILKFVTESVPESEKLYASVLAGQLKYIRGIVPDLVFNYLFHDRLAPENKAFHFHEFIGLAEKFGLQYVTEADYLEIQDFYFDENIRSLLKKMSGNNLIVKEQMLDFIKGRSFRQTLLCPEDVSLKRKLTPAVMKQFYFSCPSGPIDPDGNYLDEDTETLLTRDDIRFKRPNGPELNTDSLVSKAAFLYLSKIWPKRVHFSELLETARSICLKEMKTGFSVSDEDGQALGDTLLSAFSANLMCIHTHVPGFAFSPPAFPKASPLALLDLENGPVVTNLCHRPVNLEKTYGPYLLPLMDGTRNLNDIRLEMLQRIRENRIPLQDKYPDDLTDEEVLSQIESEIELICRHALLLPG